MKMPLSLQKGGRRKAAKKMLEALKKKFKAPKQKIDSKQKRDGSNVTKSNVKMGKPPVSTAKKGRMLVVHNFEDDPFTGRRRLVGLSELDVGRDVMDVKFITDSD
jgi:hypothetical protein